MYEVTPQTAVLWDKWGEVCEHMGLTGLQIHKDSGIWDSDAMLRVTPKSSPSHISESTRQLAVKCLFPERAMQWPDQNKALSWPQESHVTHTLSQRADHNLQAIPKFAYNFFKIVSQNRLLHLVCQWRSTQTNQASNMWFGSQLHHVSPHWHLHMPV